MGILHGLSYTQYSPKPDPLKASDPIDPDEDPFPREECPLVPSSTRPRGASQPLQPPRTPSSGPPPPHPFLSSAGASFVASASPKMMRTRRRCSGGTRPACSPTSLTRPR